MMRLLSISLLITSAILTGCTSQIASIRTSVGAMPVYKRPEYKSPQQIIYQVDEHRYITLENYEDCRVGGLMKWHDDRTNVHTAISYFKNGGSGVWMGKFKIEPGDQRIAVPTFGCGDKNCRLMIAFSNDGGRTWDKFATEAFSHSYFSPNRNSDTQSLIFNTEVKVTDDGLIYTIPYQKIFFYRNRIVSSRMVESDERCADDLYGPCQNNRSTKPPFPPLPPGGYDKYDFSIIPNIKTPSGQERFTCDTSLNPVVEKER